MASFFGANRIVPFAVAAEGSVVGIHDGARATVHLGALDDAVVFHHEYGHEAIFTRTIDGGLLAVLWQAIDRPTGLAKERLSSLATTADTLVSRSRFAHEVFATYYGLKMVDPDTALAALSCLPIEYRTYYRAAASVLDPHFLSTFLQVRVALTLSYIAFQSRFALRFLDRPWMAWKTMRRDEQPNWRMRRLLERLEDGGAYALRLEIGHWTEEFFAERHGTPWDIDDDAAWTAHGIEGNQLDVFLDKKSATWIEELGVVPVLSSEERTACFSRLRLFATDAGVRVDVVKTEAPPVPAAASGSDPALEHFRQDTAARMHALKQAGSYIANQPIGHSFPHITESELLRGPLYVQADELHVVGPDPATASNVWSVVRFGPKGAPTNCKLNGRSAYCARAATPDLIAWLNALEGDGAGHLHGRLPQTIVAPFGGGAHVSPRAFSFENEERSDGRISFAYDDRIAMYVVGNWVDFVQRSAALGAVTLTELHVDITGYDGAPQPLTIKIAFCESLPGRLHMRAFGRNAATAVDLLELDWRGNGSIRTLSTEEAEREGLDLHFIADAMNGILAFWSLF